MSSTKGNLNRSRAQKHQNRTAFKNDLYDKSVKTKFINSIQPCGICSRCRDIIQWKIKYKKYKTLSVPKKCVRCDQKAIKSAYHVLCRPCARKEGVCAKCCKKEEIIEADPALDKEQNDELEQILKALPERKRRTLLRCIRKQADEGKKDAKDDDGDGDADKVNAVDLAEKINKLKLEAKLADIEDYGSSDEDYNSISQCSVDNDNVTDFDE